MSNVRPTIFVKDLLKGKTAIVTGGGTGIGRSIAMELAKVGANIVICSRRLEHLIATSEEIRSFGVSSLAFQVDIRDVKAVTECVQSTIKQFGRIDILVNNAGGQFPQVAERLPINGWNAVINTNLNGTWYVTQEVATRSMIPNRTGKIMNITACFWRGMPGIAHTGAARAGVVNLTKSLSIEWAKYNILINCIAPGNIMTAGWKNAYGEERVGKISSQIPLGRLGCPEDIAYAVVYLASPAGDYVTGETISVDGGQQNWGNIDYFP